MEEQQKQEQQGQHEQQQEQHMETVLKEDYDKVVAELEKVKSKLPEELTEEEKAIKAKEKELFDKEVKLTLKEEGLEAFADIVKVENQEELKEVIKSLSKIVNDIKVSMGYVPSDHKQMSSYEQAKQQGNTKNMIKSLFGLN